MSTRCAAIKYVLSRSSLYNIAVDLIEQFTQVSTLNDDSNTRITFSIIG